jgi:arginase
MTGDPGHSSTLRLLMPQWQGGGNRPAFHLGGRLLAWLAPASDVAFEEVPIDLRAEGLSVDRGIFARDVVLGQTRAARRILDRRSPDRVVVFGGECSVSFAPFAYLNERYDGDMAVLWLDAHTDLFLLDDNRPNFHGMVLSALLGLGDPEFAAEMTKPIDHRRVMFVGLRALLEPIAKLRERYGITFPNASAESVERDSEVVLAWLRSAGVSRVAVHFDLDVLDPSDFSSALGSDPDGLRIAAAIRLLADVGREFDIVGLSITEYTPRDAVALAEMLRQLPIVRE